MYFSQAPSRSSWSWWLQWSGHGSYHERRGSYSSDRRQRMCRCMECCHLPPVSVWMCECVSVWVCASKILHAQFTNASTCIGTTEKRHGNGTSTHGNGTSTHGNGTSTHGNETSTHTSVSTMCFSPGCPCLEYTWCSVDGDLCYQPAITAHHLSTHDHLSGVLLFSCSYLLGSPHTIEKLKWMGSAWLFFVLWDITGREKLITYEQTVELAHTFFDNVPTQLQSLYGDRTGLDSAMLYHHAAWQALISVHRPIEFRTSR